MNPTLIGARKHASKKLITKKKHMMNQARCKNILKHLIPNIQVITVPKRVKLPRKRMIAQNTFRA